eukprot:UN24916
MIFLQILLHFYANEKLYNNNIVLAKIKEWTAKLQDQELKLNKMTLENESKISEIEFLKNRISKYEEKIISLESREIISSHRALTKNFDDIHKLSIDDEKRDMIDTMTSVKSEDMDVQEMKIYIESQKSLIGQLRCETDSREEFIKSNKNSTSKQIDEKHAIAIDELQNVT